MSKFAFNPVVFIAMLVVCGAIAGLVAWLTGLSYWILFFICVVATLLNGVIATIEDRRTKK